MAVNNMYITEQSAYRVYRKTVPSIVSGLRFAEGSKQPVPFVLTTSDDPDTSRLFVYSQLEDSFVRKENKNLFSTGILVLDLPDSTIESLVSIKSIVEFRKAIASFDRETLSALFQSDRLTPQQRKEVESRLSSTR